VNFSSPKTRAPCFAIGDSIRHIKVSDTARISTFATPAGAEEFFITVESAAGSQFSAAIDSIHEEYIHALVQYELSASTHVFCRIFLSDIENQKTHLVVSPFFRMLSDAAVSVVCEPCLRGGSIGLFSYHIRNNYSPIIKTSSFPLSDTWRRDTLIRGKNYEMLLNTNYEEPEPFDAYAQTERLFHSLDAVLHRNAMTLPGNAIRTWIFVRDIDNHYKGMVKARRDFFRRIDLTEKTRYLASTGIEGKLFHVNSLVGIDMLSISNLKPEQIVHMEARANMSPTIDYGVTFERGLRVRFGDRSHLYISGTASIDSTGEVLHHGDVEKQTARTLENVSALLTEQGASLSDLAYLIVYIRDITALATVSATINRLLPEGLPLIVVQGAVCRPAWLMEVEGVAILRDENGFPEFL
jgi:enamine deaminase RidA (YjgF/YER057c/UK114 family)